MGLRPKRLRTRLTIWYVCLLGTLLLGAMGGTCFLFFLQIRNQIDRFNIEEVETVEGLLYFSADGKLRLRDDYHNHRESKERIESLLEVCNPSGSVLLRNERLGGRGLGGRPLTSEGVGGYSQRSTRLSDGTRVRMVSRAHILEGQPLLIRLAHSEEGMQSGLENYLLASILVLPAVLGAAGLAGYFLAKRALSPIEQMALRAREITPERLSERLPIGNSDDELGRLARVFNETLDRLEQAFNQLSRFTADCSHELRTPLAMIRSVGEVGLQKNGSREEYRDIIGSMLEEVNRLTSLIDALLTISRAEAGSLQLHKTAVRLMSVVREAAEIFDVVMEEKSVHLELEGDEEAALEGDSVFLRQAVANLIDNAVKYSPMGQSVCARVRNGEGSQIILEIEDHGPGIPVEDQRKIFDRFYRVDKSRSRGSGGTGLGLSITKWAIEAHGGTITVDTLSGNGCTFRVSLPGLKRQFGGSGDRV